jgi:uncharacterized protein
MNAIPPKTDRTWEILCHVAALTMFVGIPLGNIIGPLVPWLIKKNISPSVDEHGRESLNFQITVTLLLMTASLATLLLSFILIGFLLVPVLIGLFIAVPVIDAVLVVIAAVKASNGEFYRYPFNLRLIT